jgi:hypothetical protein
VDGPFVTVLRTPLITVGNHILSGAPEEKRITRSLMSEETETLMAGDRVSLHWDTICECISEKESRLLDHHTEKALRVRNTRPFL